MFYKMLMYFVIFLCGYILNQWISITYPFVLAEFFIRLVMDPLKFFAASLVFFIGFLMTGRTIRELIHRTEKIFQKQAAWRTELIFEFMGLFFIFSFLFYLEWKQTLVFFSMSLFYGMISSELLVKKRGK